MLAVKPSWPFSRITDQSHMHTVTSSAKWDSVKWSSTLHIIQNITTDSDNYFIC